MRVAIVGGAGKIARLLLARLLEDGHEVVSLARREEQLAELAQAGAESRFLDIEAAGAAQWRDALAGADAVVFAAGGGPDGNAARKLTVDLGGSVSAMRTAEALGIRRFVQVSAIGVDTPADPSRGEVWTAYVEAKRDADEELRRSALDWTILRPGSLTDEPGTGRVALAPEVPRGAVPRADVAAAIALCLADDRTIGRQWEIVSGDLSIVAAIDAAL